MSMSKRVRKGISLLASFAMSAGLMVGVFAAPSAAVADTVTINTPTGVKADWWYNQSLHGQLCDFYFNEGTDYDYSYANEGVFINGTFAGPNAAEMELTDVTLIDMPEGSTNDDYELAWVDFNRSARSGFDFDDLDSDESQDCSSNHDFEVYMEDSSEGESEFAEWDLAGDYTYRLTFANSFNEGNGSITLTQDVTITVAGEAVSSELELSANGGDATDSVIWPIHTDSSDFDGYNEGGYDTNTWVAANLRYYDADGNLTHLDDYNTNWEYSYTEGDVSDAAWATEDFYQVVWSESDWGEELWIMSNDYTGYQIFENGEAEEYNEAHESEFGYDFGSTPAYFLLPNTDEGDDYFFLPADDTNLGDREIGWIQGLVDEFGDFTDGPQITFYVGSDIAEVSTFWVRTTDVLADLDTEGDDSFDSNPVSVDFRGWVDPVTLNESSAVTLGAGIARAQNWNDYDDSWFIRTDVDSINYVYAGGEDNAGLFIDFNIAANDFTSNSELNYDIDSDAANYVMLTNAAGGVTVNVDVSDNVDGDNVLMDFATMTDDEGQVYTTDELIVRAPGYYPQFRLQNTSTITKAEYDPDADGTNAPYIFSEFTKSYVFGSTLNLTYKVTDAWNTPITNYGVWLGYYTNFGPNATFDVYDDFNLTDANGLVSFTVTNDQTSDEIAEYHGCEDVDNCQEDHNADTTEMWRQAWIYAYPDTFASVDDDYESDYLDAEFVRSIAVDDLNLYTVGTDEDGIHIDTEGDELEQIYASVNPVNADGVGLSGLPYSISASEGGYFLADSMLCEDGYLDNDVNWGSSDWGCMDGNYIDYLTDAIDVSQFASGSASGTASRKLHEFHLTGTLVGTTTFTITVGGVSEEISQDYYNLVEDARFIANVAGDANNVIAGNVATATFKVTDRFGNAVEDVYVTFSENSIAEFAMNDDDGANGTTDANGLVSVDVVTPANSMSSGTVTAEFETEQDPLENEDFGIDAAVESADATVSWTHITPTINVKALKYRAGVKVFVKNAVGNITRVFVDGKMKRVFVPATVNGFKKILLKKGGKRTVVVTVASPLGNIFETFELKLKKNKK